MWHPTAGGFFFATIPEAKSPLLTVIFSQKFWLAIPVPKFRLLASFVSCRQRLPSLHNLAILAKDRIAQSNSK